jgi:hypothetical protein
MKPIRVFLSRGECCPAEAGDHEKWSSDHDRTAANLPRNLEIGNPNTPYGMVRPYRAA